MNFRWVFFSGVFSLSTIVWQMSADVDIYVVVMQSNSDAVGIRGNSRVMICPSSSAHWQQASKLQACGALNRFGKIEINAPMNII